MTWEEKAAPCKGYGFFLLKEISSIHTAQKCQAGGAAILQFGPGQKKTAKQSNILAGSRKDSRLTIDYTLPYTSRFSRPFSRF
jgi:hypothetical protein